MAKKSREQAIFGDFQTPPALAALVCRTLAKRQIKPTTILEPTCGDGHFLVAATTYFPTCRHRVGVEINPVRLQRAREALATTPGTELVCGDFFRVDWSKLLATLQDPLLVVGNPPWVTNAELSVHRGQNLPEKTNNRAGFTGLDGLTGKSNFDISQWICQHLVERLQGREATLAMLVKTSVGRKVVADAWSSGAAVRGVELHMLDAKQHFGAHVDACLLLAHTGRAGERTCRVYQQLSQPEVACELGYEPGVGLIADRVLRDATRGFETTGAHQTTWRSGIKHDCAKVFELRAVDGQLVNGFGEVVDIESEYCLPLRKSSDVAHDRLDTGRYLVVPQRRVGEDTAGLQRCAPKLWQYLSIHGDRLDARKSRIYRGRPRFSIFGIGDYTFSPWKVAISGLYKSLEFRLVGPASNGKPVVFDDTVYFLACESRGQAAAIHAALMSKTGQQFFSALIFWDQKRPVTAGLLRRLDLEKLVEHCRQTREVG